MEAQRPNVAARIHDLYWLVTVSHRNGRKVIQRAHAKRLCGPWTVERGVFLDTGSDRDFDGKHVDRESLATTPPLPVGRQDGAVLQQWSVRQRTVVSEDAWGRFPSLTRRGLKLDLKHGSGRASRPAPLQKIGGDAVGSTAVWWRCGGLHRSPAARRLSRGWRCGGLHRSPAARRLSRGWRCGGLHPSPEARRLSRGWSGRGSRPPPTRRSAVPENGPAAARGQSRPDGRRSQGMERPRLAARADPTVGGPTGWSGRGRRRAASQRTTAAFSLARCSSGGSRESGVASPPRPTPSAIPGTLVPWKSVPPLCSKPKASACSLALRVSVGP